jgi:hypothetical protein
MFPMRVSLAIHFLLQKFLVLEDDYNAFLTFVNVGLPDIYFATHSVPVIYFGKEKNKDAFNNSKFQSPA